MHATFMRRLAAVCVTAAIACGLVLSGSGAGATVLSHRSGSPTQHALRPLLTQVIKQHATTKQHATARAVSVQALPVNLNLPIQILSIGSNGGDVDQRNTSVAASKAANRSTTIQSAHQHQKVNRPASKPTKPKGTAKPHVAKPRVRQNVHQTATTKQEADAHAASVQILPVNVNAPVQVASVGSNGGDTDQRNTSVGAARATNTAQTIQKAHQDQHVTPPAPKPTTPQGNATPVKQPKPVASASQDVDQHARTEQAADARSASVQVAPINVNAPIQVLSVGTNGGDTDQRNTSVAAAEADNRGVTIQLAGQSQRLGAPPAPQGGGTPSASQNVDQHARTEQAADARSASVQVAPINVNAPIQVLSVGTNGGDTDQSNTSVGAAKATNTAKTVQGGLQQLVSLG